MLFVFFCPHDPICVVHCGSPDLRTQGYLGSLVPWHRAFAAAELRPRMAAQRGFAGHGYFGAPEPDEVARLPKHHAGFADAWLSQSFVMLCFFF